jgi:hypothetical protein
VILSGVNVSGLALISKFLCHASGCAFLFMFRSCAVFLGWRSIAVKV